MNLRLLSAKIIGRVLKEGQSLTAALDQLLPEGIKPQDKAFVQAICYGVIRQFYPLEFLLNQLVIKPIKDNEVKVLALMGIYQLAYMRVKEHAAVSETVAALPRKKIWAKSLINAVLRNYQRQQDQLQANLDNDPVLAAGHPKWLITLIQQDWPEQAGTIFLENNRQAPMVLRVNQSRLTRGQYLQRLTDNGIAAAEVSAAPAALILEHPVPVEQLPGFGEGLVSVQDAAAQLAAGLLGVDAGHRVLDICAAPGGKTAHLLEIQPELAELVALDCDAARMQRVEENMARLGLNATLLVGDAANPDSWWDGKLFDRILVDAPCSGLGVIRRHPDIKLLRKPDDMAKLVELQASILNAIWPLLLPGGVLVYATCSIHKQENEFQMATFLKAHDDAQEFPIEPLWGIQASVGRQILTGESGMDGFYYARLRKQ
ncbi:MAG: 16S rRNA (cytosine(967)-C(5))-methyltransferase RsmB [Methylicorpusculum sp.]|nr:16S rRNA (cytosine(967)-C(5))-methyltransferase RsmB [Methylicorpusculum sp.]